MVVNITGRNAPEAYNEGLQQLRVSGVDDTSRNGPVKTILEPVYLTIYNPCERVIFDAFRDANPFFHVMEAIWMFAGENDVRWLEQFNKRYRNYADKNSDVIHGAYGYRWRKHFGHDQIQRLVDMLVEEPTTRRAVLGMWDPTVDLNYHNDLPCNTHILFRTINDALHMTVMNRSNDFVWGMMGANVVHMTMLQELIASAAGMPLGHYHVITNNLHIYTEMPRFPGIWNSFAEDDRYGEVQPYPLLDMEPIQDFLKDAERLVANDLSNLKTKWFQRVALPMYLAWVNHIDFHPIAYDYIGAIQAKDWRIACQEWLDRRIA